MFLLFYQTWWLKCSKSKNKSSFSKSKISNLWLGSCAYRLEQCLSCLHVTFPQLIWCYAVAMQCLCIKLPRLRNTQTCVPPLPLTPFSHFSIFVISFLSSLCSSPSVLLLFPYYVFFSSYLLLLSSSTLSIVFPLSHFITFSFILYVHTSAPSFLPKGSPSCYHTERAGMAGYAQANWESVTPFSVPCLVGGPNAFSYTAASGVRVSAAAEWGSCYLWGVLHPDVYAACHHK